VPWGSAGGNLYDVYRPRFDAHETVPSPLEIDLSVELDTLAGSGSAGIAVRNVSGDSVRGKLHVAVCEDLIAQQWQTMDTVHLLERAMLPDGNGEGIALGSGDSLQRTRALSIDTTWNWHNCYLVAFVQDSASRDIYQGAKLSFAGGLGLEARVPGPRVGRIAPARPTPFTFRTELSYELTAGGSVDFSIYSASGTPVRTLALGQRPAGRYTVSWDGRDARGRRVQAGVYYAQVSVGGNVLRQKLVRM
jgi:hypothetical protein